MRDLNGKVLLIGVDHDADTTIHVAELLANVPYRVPKHITVLKDGRPTRIEYRENDHCCQRFKLANDWLRALGQQSEGRVGQRRRGSRALATSSMSCWITYAATR